ncbi:unnamed protein product [Cyberlindnera jadinii]|uniref:Xylanolytic transcriptional activator regulatory domain-containing protein n=1 Tax=Cyberlindnera jadinii (strain ATCC 18201 / CBS 1600 / BCRC 20928 / JCM 3617 / NBRC 0987 / NRRL Y-1542) TaxID=983966 RepID=A0A0H5BZN4_CYBJN|nr:unnamed protein product [Cyberlindnera jadinii]
MRTGLGGLLEETNVPSNGRSTSINKFKPDRVFMDTTPASYASSRSKSDYANGLKQINNRIQLLESALRLKSDRDSLSSSSGTTLAETSPNEQRNGSAAFGIMPESEYEIVDFHRDSFPAPGMSYKGSLTWVSLLRKDKFLNSITLSIRNKKTILQECQHDTKAYEFSKVLCSQVDAGSEKIPLRNPHDMPIVTLVSSYLKDRRLVWLLVDRFFDSELALVYPVLLREVFEEDVANLIGGRNDPTATINFTRRQQCSTAGIVLLVMRFASLSLFNLDNPVFGPESQWTDDQKHMVTNPISKDVNTAVEKCIEETEKLKEVTLEAFQLTLLKRWYELISPEEADCVTAITPGKLGQLLHHAIQCSINRDPTKTPFATNSPNNFLRRLWLMVMQLDVYQLTVVGGHPLIDKNMYDTDLPQLDESSTPDEFSLDKSFCDYSKLSDLLYSLLNEALNLRKPLKLFELKRELRPLEEYIVGLPDVHQILARPCDTVAQRALNYRSMVQYMDCVSLLGILYYHIFLHYCSKMDVEQSAHYCCEILRVGSLLYPIVLFFDKKNTEFDLQRHFGCPAVIIPRFESCFHRLDQLFFSIIARVKVIKLCCTQIESQKIQMMDQILAIAEASTRHVLHVYKTISSTYYHAWVVSKAHSFIVSRLLRTPSGAIGNASPLDEHLLDSFKSIGDDDVFFRFTTSHLERIRQTLQAFQEIDLIGSLSNSPLDGTIGFEDNGRWLKQVMQDIANDGRNDYVFEDDRRFPAQTALNSGYASSIYEGNEITNGASVDADVEASAVLNEFFSGYDIEEYLLKQSAAEYGIHF